MSKWNLIVDVAKCSNCNNCAMAMKDEYIGNDFAGYSAAQPNKGHEWIAIDRHVRGNDSMVDVAYVPRTCNHCDDAPCVQAGKGAVSKRDDGIVIIDPVKAKGRQDLVGACPYGAIHWNEEQQLPQHWTFDAHLLDAGWKQPRIAQVCATGALRSIKVSDEQMAALVKQDNLQVLKPELKTRPRIYYRGLKQATHAFLGGNVSARGKDGLVDNVEGAKVELTLGGKTLQASTDGFGDFKIDGLLPDSGEFTLRVSHAEFGAGEVKGSLAASQYLGSIELR